MTDPSSFSAGLARGSQIPVCQRLGCGSKLSHQGPQVVVFFPSTRVPFRLPIFHLFLLSAPPKPSPKLGFKSPNKNTQVPRPKRTSLKTGEGAGRTTELPFPFGMYRTVQAVGLQGWLQHWSQDSSATKRDVEKRRWLNRVGMQSTMAQEKKKTWPQSHGGNICLGELFLVLSEDLRWMKGSMYSIGSWFPLRPLPALHDCCYRKHFTFCFCGLVVEVQPLNC